MSHHNYFSVFIAHFMNFGAYINTINDLYFLYTFVVIFVIVVDANIAILTSSIT